jgi:threonine-phosphate decarboxylase
VKFAKNIATHTLVPHGGLYSIENPRSTITDFSSNVNPLGYPASVKRLLRSWMEKIPVYPDHNSKKLKKQLSSYLGVSTSNLVVGNGATEVIYNFCRAIIGKHTSVLIPIPTFGEYEAAVRLCAGRLQFFKTMNLERDLARFMKKIPKNGVIFVCNPNNPTGALVSKKSIIQIAKHAKTKNTTVFVDECFMELTQTPQQSVIDQIQKLDNLFVLRSLTKSFGLAGLRVGYGVGSKSLVSVLDKIKIPWNVSGLAQEAAITALSERNFLTKTRKMIKTESAFLKNYISELDGFSCFETATNFILIKTKTNSKHLQKKLLQKKILIRDCSTFRGLTKNYVRIAVKTHKDNLKLVKILERLS